jgi:hypothetical protein
MGQSDLTGENRPAFQTWVRAGKIIFCRSGFLSVIKNLKENFNTQPKKSTKHLASTVKLEGQIYSSRGWKRTIMATMVRNLQLWYLYLSHRDIFTPAPQGSYWSIHDVLVTNSWIIQHTKAVRSNTAKVGDAIFYYSAHIIIAWKSTTKEVPLIRDNISGLCNRM